jgi:hypothetical protein
MVLQKYSNISHGKKVLDECLFNRLKYFLSDKQWFILDVMQRGKGSGLGPIKKVEKSPPFLPQILP